MLLRHSTSLLRWRVLSASVKQTMLYFIKVVALSDKVRYC